MGDIHLQGTGDYSRNRTECGLPTYGKFGVGVDEEHSNCNCCADKRRKVVLDRSRVREADENGRRSLADFLVERSGRRPSNTVNLLALQAANKLPAKDQKRVIRGLRKNLAFRAA